MLNSRAADHFVLSYQHCPISFGKIALDWSKLLAGDVSEDQELVGSTSASTAVVQYCNNLTSIIGITHHCLLSTKLMWTVR